jgi:dTDP-4-amino-4,6-dideoxygalactose transaminase
MKIAKSLAELAAFGGNPAYSDPLHVGRPNIGDVQKYIKAVEGILTKRWLSNDGPEVRDFEKRLADHLKVRNVVAVCNGTVGLQIAINALDLTGEIILPSYTFVATAHSVHWQGIKPVFADIEKETHCIDIRSIKKLITHRTTGIIGVHLWGRTTNIYELETLCRDNNLSLIFDAAHAFNCTYNNISIGNFGNCEVFSFHATKFLNSHEGGAIATNDDKLASKIRLIRNFGFKGYDDVIYPGTNGKMAEVCAAMGLVNLESLEDFVAINRRNFQDYKTHLSKVENIRIMDYDHDERNNFQYIVIEVEKDFPFSRDKIVEILHAENILARKYFWPGVHQMTPYRDLYPFADSLLPVTNQVSGSVIVLPTGTSVSENDIRSICSIFDVLSHGYRI